MWSLRAPVLEEREAWVVALNSNLEAARRITTVAAGVSFDEGEAGGGSDDEEEDEEVPLHFLLTFSSRFAHVFCSRFAHVQVHIHCKCELMNLGSATTAATASTGASCFRLTVPVPRVCLALRCHVSACRACCSVDSETITACVFVCLYVCLFSTLSNLGMKAAKYPKSSNGADSHCTIFFFIGRSWTHCGSPTCRAKVSKRLDLAGQRLVQG
jgi:hypothetical protein